MSGIGFVTVHVFSSVPPDDTAVYVPNSLITQFLTATNLIAGRCSTVTFAILLVFARACVWGAKRAQKTGS